MDTIPQAKPENYGHTTAGQSFLEGLYQPKWNIGKVFRIFSYVPTSTELTNAISKTQLSGPKKGGFSPK